MIVLYALIGLVVGGVINLLADVLPYRHKKISTPNCARPAANPDRRSSPWRWSPYLTRKRACPSCGRPIAIRNVIVELGTAALFALLYSTTSIW